MSIFKKALAVLGMLIVSAFPSFANQTSQTTELSFAIPTYTKIYAVTSPVLTANITNRTGNLNAPLSTRFRVITNTAETQTLYLQAHVNTQDGYESAMFEQGGQVYVAFTSLSKMPTSSSLNNCKMGSMPKDSPGVVAYPVTSVYGASNKYIRGKNKYEIYITEGKTDIVVNIGANVLRNSFAANDPRGYYQAILSLTEADI